VLEFVRALVGAVGDDNRGQVLAPAASVVASLLEETEHLSASAEVLDALLSPLLPSRREEEPRAHEVAVAVLRAARGPEVHTGILGFVLDALQGGRLSAASELRPHAHELVLALCEACPEAATPALPTVAEDLGKEDPGRRLRAVELLGALLAAPGAPLLSAAPETLPPLLGRARDASAEVRAAVVRSAGAALAEVPGGAVQDQLLEALRGRLTDPDDAVRLAAVRALLSPAAAAALARAPGGPAALSALTERLRDVRPAIRAEAFRGLAAAFRDAAAAGAPGPLARLPGLLAGRLCGDPELRGSSATEGILSGDAILPPGTPPDAAARAWADVHRASDPADRRALEHVLALKGNVREHGARLIALRRQLRDARRGDLGPALASQGQGPGADAAQQQAVRRAQEGLARCVKSLARLVHADAGRAEAALQRLADHKDNALFASLGKLCRGELDAAGARAAAADVLQRFGGSRAPGAEPVRALCAWMAPGPVPPAAVGSLAALAARGTPGAAGLLVALAQAAPATVAPHLPALLRAAAPPEGEPPAAGAAEGCLRAAAAVARADPAAGAAALAGDGVGPPLRRLCQRGAAKEAKFAARFLALSAGGDAEAARGLLDGAVSRALLESGKPRPDVPALRAALECVGAVGPLFPSLVEERLGDLAEAVAENVLRMPAEALEPARGRRAPDPAPAGDGAPGPAAATKGAALKALTRCLTPGAGRGEGPAPGHAPAPAGQLTQGSPRLAEALRGTLVPALEEASDPTVEGPGVPGGAGGGHVRLQAFKCLHRVVRAMDVRAPHSALVALALCLQDPLAPVRQAALAHLSDSLAFTTRHAALGGDWETLYALPAARTAACLGLSACDPVEEHRAAAAAALAAFAQSRRQAAHAAAQGPGAGDGAARLAPDNALPYAVALLVRHPDCPPVEAHALSRSLPGAGEVAPFVEMLGSVLVPLLAPAPGVPAAGALPLVVKVLRAVKHARWVPESPEDDEAGLTETMRMLCDVALWTARAVASAMVGEPAWRAMGKHPGSVMLPRALFRFDEALPPLRDYTHLPEGLEGLPAGVAAAAKAAVAGRRAGAPRAAPRRPRGAAAAAARGEGAGPPAGPARRAPAPGPEDSLELDASEGDAAEGDAAEGDAAEPSGRGPGGESGAGGGAASGDAVSPGGPGGEGGEERAGSSPGQVKRARSQRQPLSTRTNGAGDAAEEPRAPRRSRRGA